MKKIIIPFLIFVLFSSVAIAVSPNDAGQKGVQNTNATTEDSQPGQGQQAQTEQKTQNSGEEQQIQTENQEQSGQNFILENPERARTLNEAKEMVKERKQEMEQEIQEFSDTVKKVYQNQNQVREAVHTLLSIEDLALGIGSQVSEIAREFNNSVKTTIAAEEKTQKRNAFVRFFIGGDQDAAENIEQELNQNQERVLELKQLEGECDCDEEVKTVIQEQIQTIEQEQVRLQDLVDNEKSSNGVFGWIRNLFRFGR